MSDAKHPAAAPAEGEPARAFRPGKGKDTVCDLCSRRVCLGRHANRGYGGNRGDEMAKRACENTDHRVRLVIATGVRAYSTRR